MIWVPVVIWEAINIINNLEIMTYFKYINVFENNSFYFQFDREKKLARDSTIFRIFLKVEIYIYLICLSDIFVKCLKKIRETPFEISGVKVQKHSYFKAKVLLESFLKRLNIFRDRLELQNMF